MQLTPLPAIALVALGAVATPQAPGGSGHLAVPLRFTAVPPESFRPGASVTLKATFAADLRPTGNGGACGQTYFVIRVYDAKRVARTQIHFQPDVDAKPPIPVTPYLQQSGGTKDPTPQPGVTALEEVFEPFVFPAKVTRNITRIFVALGQSCDAAKPVDIDLTGSIIFDKPLNAGYLGGAFFSRKCSGAPIRCVYSQE